MNTSPFSTHQSSGMIGWIAEASQHDANNAAENVKETVVPEGNGLGVTGGGHRGPKVP